VRNQQREQSQEERIAELEAQAHGSAPDAPAPAPAGTPAAAPAAGGGEDIAGKLVELAGLMEKGILTPDEFAAAKAKLLAG
jgi:hypothetical protein